MPKKTLPLNKRPAGTLAPSDLPKLAAPAQRALAGAGPHTLDQLTRRSEAELA